MEEPSVGIWQPKRHAIPTPTKVFVKAITSNYTMDNEVENLIKT